ncbi:conserved hypothetical protein [Nitrolancea hollandica Lb]|uniref:Uncharacterized protein n=1 Tax=Nitrolancea hollandica Lb TaxID=1129897 RepID=I4EN93_9BACT|nr:conserved hypothetical protein [Nitrolancea hollandica Lb]
MGREGFEPPKLSHLVYSQAPLAAWESPQGADGGTRTRNRLFTKQLLCQLSYVGAVPEKHAQSRRQPEV